MILDFKMIAILSILLCVVLIQGAHGTFFPPVNDGPPIPSQAARGLGNPPQIFNAPEDLPRDLHQPNEEGFLPLDTKPDEERWYYEENQPREARSSQSSIETFDSYYQSGEPAVGPVATPIPDDTYLAQSSSISRLNPTDIGNTGNSGIFILARDVEGQYKPERWVQVQIPAERLIEVVNQDPGIQVATDTVKSFVAPVSFETSPKTQISANPPVNIVQVRPSNAVELQKTYTNFPRVVENVPSVKQVVDVPPPLNVKKLVQEKVVNDVPPLVFPPPAQISPKKSFSVPPPPPPLLKGVNSPPKVVSSVPINVIPDSNVVVSSKNIIPDTNIAPGKNVVQQVRHVWIPTSSKTGKFITIPISGSINSAKSTINKGFSLDSTPVTVSDTWVLKQDGPVPIFEQQKSALPPISSPVVQSGKVIFQNPTIVQVDESPNPIVTKVESPKNPPIIEKQVAPNGPIDIWPARKELASPKVLDNFGPIITSDLAPAAGKSDGVIIGNAPSPFVPIPQKTILSDTKSLIPPPIPSPPVQIVNGKPCPLPLSTPQKSSFQPLNSGIISVPRIISTQSRLPFARIIRVNRFPTGSYYLLNRNIRPSYFVYPGQSVIQQPKSGLISVIQSKQLPVQFQGKVPVPSVQIKQISIPVQSKQIASPLPAKQVAYPYLSRQVILPAIPPKSSRIIYPSVQAVRYAYPWNAAYLKSSPILGNGGYVPEFSSFKIGSKKTKSKSSSSESSSESSSSEESSESSKEKSKKGKSKKEDKSKTDENSNSSQSEREIESESISNSKESGSEEKESEEKSSEKESEESLETSDSQMSLKFQLQSDEPTAVTGENTLVNIIPSLEGAVDDETPLVDEQ